MKRPKDTDADAAGEAHTELGRIARNYARYAKELEARIERVVRMCNAYPLDIFPEFDHKKAHEVLKQHGMTIDQVSASMARHVLERVPSILRGEGGN